MAGLDFLKMPSLTAIGKKTLAHENQMMTFLQTDLFSIENIHLEPFPYKSWYYDELYQYTYRSLSYSGSYWICIWADQLVSGTSVRQVVTCDVVLQKVICPLGISDGILYYILALVKH